MLVQIHVFFQDFSSCTKNQFDTDISNILEMISESGISVVSWSEDDHKEYTQYET
jgi:hypothetical protein